MEYTGNKDYRTILENLLRLTRAMGISFVLCSQTIASGLSGLTDSARDQIGCRLCLQHNDDNEIRETLALSGSDTSLTTEQAKKLSNGRGIYKRMCPKDEETNNGCPYEFKDVFILFLDNEDKEKVIYRINKEIGDSYIPKEEIFVRGGGRISLEERRRHPIVKFMKNHGETELDGIVWYPAAPTTLADSFCVELEDNSGANILFVGEADDLRESVVLHSICGFLMNPNVQVIASFVDEKHPDRKRLLDMLKKISSPRLKINNGIASTLITINKIKKIRPQYDSATVYLWYGLDKLKNELFLLEQEEEEERNQVDMSKEDMIADLMGLLSDFNFDDSGKQTSIRGEEQLTFEECRKILRQNFESGPENNHFHMVLFNNYKGLKKSGVIELDDFENRIGSRMSVDDSYALFDTSLAINKTDDNTVIYYAGSGQIVPLRPYLLPDDKWYKDFSNCL